MVNIMNLRLTNRVVNDGCSYMDVGPCGAILGGGTVEEIQRLNRFGVYVGKVQGLLSKMGRSEGGNEEQVQKWRDLALKELEYFDSKKADQISTIVKV